MNCDQAFDAMTDPDRDDSPLLDEHLADCPRCRQMYATLEPALGLFDVPDDETTAVTDHHSAHEMMPSVQMAQQVATRLAANGPVTNRHGKRRQYWGTMLAASALGFLLSFSLLMLMNDDHSRSLVIVTECTWLNRDAVSRSEEARAVVHTCVTCHVVRAAEGQQSHSSLIDASEELERQLSFWHRVAFEAVGSPTLIAQHTQENSCHV